MVNVPARYVPKGLSKKDRKIQKRELKKSRKMYKGKKYYTRKKVKSFKSKVSPHILKARKMYKIEKITPSRKLAKASKCSLKGLKRMFKKGQGAYFSSGSRPNQTAKKTRKTYKRGRRRVKQTKIGGRRKSKMKERILKFKRGPFPKKYTAIVQNKKTKKTRVIHFGDRRYQQYKDRTPLKLYAKKNHGTRKRIQNYFSRHSGTKYRGKAIKKELKKSHGYYNPKILSHIYLW